MTAVGISQRIRKRWKSVERALAKRLGGERVPVTGRTRGYAPDIRHNLYSIEVKSRKRGLVVLAEMMDQARKAREFYLARGEGERIPLGIYHVAGSRLDSALVFISLEDFERWFDPLLKSYRLMEEIRAKAGL